MYVHSNSPTSTTNTKSSENKEGNWEEVITGLFLSLMHWIVQLKQQSSGSCEKWKQS